MALMEISHWEALLPAARRLLDLFSLHSFLVRTRIIDDTGWPHVYVLSTLPTILSDRFFALGEDDGGLVSTHVYRRATPIVWGIDDIHYTNSASPYRELIPLGVKTTWSVAARNARSVSRLDFHSTEQGRFTPDLQSQLLLFSCYFNEATSALWLRDNQHLKAPELSRREQECLRWSAIGKTSSEIGSILGISRNTVYFHLKKVAVKFGVYGTRHAISRAMELGLI